jgi:hypothetical protein
MSQRGRRRTRGKTAFEIEQYRQSLEYVRHLDSLNWQIASILVAGVLIALGQSLQGNPNPPYPLSVRIIATLGVYAVFMWLLLVSRDYQVSNAVQSIAMHIENDQRGFVTRLTRDFNPNTGAPNRNLLPHSIVTMTILAGILIVALIVIIAL